MSTPEPNAIEKEERFTQLVYLNAFSDLVLGLWTFISPSHFLRVCSGSEIALSPTDWIIRVLGSRMVSWCYTLFNVPSVPGLHLKKIAVQSSCFAWIGSFISLAIRRAGVRPQFVTPSLLFYGSMSALNFYYGFLY
eukprot:TRINITY_DN3049_c0_g1_i1.p1 TRINITY_DN3049_c0_g1~~TRINITY_DN3049_c0_g1_i1.p1  ORF type:complete len:147 (-),score=10.64 TRINITY_DN3049_c0_g1_i1:79-486(-)